MGALSASADVASKSKAAWDGVARRRGVEAEDFVVGGRVRGASGLVAAGARTGVVRVGRVIGEAGERFLCWRRFVRGCGCCGHLKNLHSGRNGRCNWVVAARPGKPERQTAGASSRTPHRSKSSDRGKWWRGLALPGGVRQGGDDQIVTEVLFRLRVALCRIWSAGMTDRPTANAIGSAFITILR